MRINCQLSSIKSDETLWSNNFDLLVDEVFDVLALFALGEINKNIFLLNINNFWLPFLEIIQHLKKNKMIRDSDDKFIEARSLKNLYVVNTIEEIFSHPQFI